jgi:Flp pilus assembly pilin Flp
MRLRREQSGQDLIEYALIACLIALIAAASIVSVGRVIHVHYKDSVTTLAVGKGEIPE